MRSNIKNTSLIIALLILTVILVYLLFGNTEIKSIFIYIFLAGFVSILGYLIWGNLSTEKSEKSHSILSVPNSRLDEDPKIVFKQSLNV